MKNRVTKWLAALVAVVLLIPMGATFAFAADEAPLTHNEKWGDDDGDGIFEVATAEDLLAVAALRPKNNNYQGKTIRLTADIDLNPGWVAKDGSVPVNKWQSMFHFNGTLDGQGHTVRGLYCAADSNASFITNITGGAVKNLRIENSAFIGTGKNVGFIACVRGEALLENLYVDAIVEAEGGGAGGIVAWHFSSDSSITPKSTFNNCVFVGTVKSTNYAAGILGTNDKHTAKLFDCANYGTITSSNNDLAAGIVGRIASNIDITRCYNYGLISSGVAIMNAVLNYELTANIIDTYFYVGTSTKGHAEYAGEEVKGVTKIAYAGASDTSIKYANMKELLQINEFKKTDSYAGWAMNDTNTMALPAGVLPLISQHTYKTTVTPPTCSQKGFTTYTCESCGHSYDGDFVEMLPHTEAENWIVDKEPTDKQPGSQHKDCTVCGKTVKAELIPKLGSDDDVYEKSTNQTTEATTTKATPAATEPAEESGCGGTLVWGGSVALFTVVSLGAAVISKKKREI